MGKVHESGTTLDTPEEIEMFQLLRLATALALEINTGMKATSGSVLSHLREQAITNKATKHGALVDLTDHISDKWTTYEPSPSVAKALATKKVKSRNVAAASISRALYEAGIQQGYKGTRAGYWANGKPAPMCVVDWIEAPDSTSDTSAAGLAPIPAALAARGYRVQTVVTDAGPTVLHVSKLYR